MLMIALRTPVAGPTFTGNLRTALLQFIRYDSTRETTMKPSIALPNHRNAIRRVVEANRARNAREFGSVAIGQDSENSDILVDPTPDTTLFDIGAIQSELSQLLGVPVDVLTRNALPDRSRGAVLAEAVPV
jgi:predicted nucleotidyltransferase